MKHYTKEELEMYRHGELSVIGKITCSTHLQQCSKCRKMLEELNADDQLLKELRVGIQLFKELSEKPSATSR